MSTKERILTAALDLFSQYGYSGTGMREIASAIGIRDSSIYKHFVGKRAIFDAIIDELARKMEGLTTSLGIVDATKGDSFESFGHIREEELCELSRKIFLFYLKDPFVSACRRMLTIEQYKNSDVASLYRSIFMEQSIEYQTLVFQQLIDRGSFVGNDPEVMALEFYAPIFLLLSRYDQRPEHEAEALDLLDRHVRVFSRNFGEQAKA